LESTESIKRTTEDTDVVVIGGGGCGMTAATTAAEKGAKVVVLDKHGIGGNTVMGNDIFAADSPPQARMNLSRTKDAAFKIAMNFSHWSVNQRIVRAWVNESGNTIRWLEDKGLIFECPPMYGPDTWAPHGIKDTKGTGADIVKTLRRECEERGVKIYTQTPVKRILRDERGHVTGVVAAAKDGELQVNAKSVIISSGGYGGNKELLKKYNAIYHENMINRGLPLMGDGLLMAMDIGAATEGLGRYLIHGQIYSVDWSILEVMGRERYTMWANKKGIRFTDETLGGTGGPVDNGNVADRQPEKAVFSLFDEAIKQRFIGERDPASRRPRGGGVPPNTDLDEVLKQEAPKGGVKIADTWDEIAAWMGADPEVLKATIAKYNASCDNGYDEMFNKDPQYLLPLRKPPYYAIRCYASFMTTLGGIKINEHMQVLDAQDDPIPGLYAGGDCAGGVQSESYCMVLAGSAMSFALNSGRIAGEHAAEYARSAS
jgi:fumarate reductase flavoprotein subunit